MNRFMLMIALACVLLGSAYAQEETDEIGKVLFVEPPKTVEEALEQRAKAEEAAAAELQKAEQAYAEKTAAADKELAGFLSQLARQAVASGDLPAAAKAWEKVLEVQPDSQDAVEFFRTIGKEPDANTTSGKPNGKTDISPYSLKARDVAGKRVEFFWQKTNWQFLPNGTILNEDTKRVMENAAIWKIEMGQLAIYDSNKNRVAIQFSPIKVNGELLLLGNPAQYIHFKKPSAK